jgi:hypothetical protein
MPNKHNCRYASKRPVLLLEVLIAFALVALCVFPLVAPHVFILKAQYQFNHKITLDQAAAKVYGHILEMAYRNQIPWQAFEQKQTFPISEDIMRAAGIENGTYKGTYQFSISRQKGKETPLTARVITATIAFLPKDRIKESSQESTYEYQFFAVRINQHETPPS